MSQDMLLMHQINDALQAKETNKFRKNIPLSNQTAILSGGIGEETASFDATKIGA
jgi:hypothetical protein